MVAAIISLAVLCLCLVVYNILTRPSSQEISESFIKQINFKLEQINFKLRVENVTLKDFLEKKDKLLLLYKEFFIRAYIEWFYKVKLNAQDYYIYTVDALESLKDELHMALDHFYEVWGEEHLKRRGSALLFKEEILEEILARVEHLLAETKDDNWDGDDRFCIFNRDNDLAFNCFFHAVETSLDIDLSRKEQKRLTKELGYWRPMPIFDEWG